MNALNKDLNWLKMELRIERALSAIMGQSLEIMEQSQEIDGYPSDELMAASDALDDAVELINAALVIYKHEAQEQHA